MGLAAAGISGRLYVCGGSSGTQALSSGERFLPEAWIEPWASSPCFLLLGERKLRGPNWGLFLLGQKSCRPKVLRIFKIFGPNFAPNFAPNFSRIFRGFFVLRFVGNGDQKKFTKNPRHFSMQNSQVNTQKIFTKCFWRAGKVIFLYQRVPPLTAINGY